MAPEPVDLARTAGAVVYRLGKDGPEVLIVHRPSYRDWSLPKGHLDEGETYEEAALREVEEETGLTGSLGAEIGAIGYQTRRKQKVVRYWLLHANKGSFVPNEEADKALWVPTHKATTLVSYTRDANVLRRAEQLLHDPTSAMVYLVRHGDAGRRSAWDKADHKRPLSKRGLLEATKTKDWLLEVPVSRVCSSPFVRCEQTVTPLAEALGLAVEVDPTIAEGSAPEDVIGLLRGLQNEAVVLCSHGDVIAGVIGQLAAEGTHLGSKLKWQKASIWYLELERGRVVDGRYEPPPE